MAGSGTRGAFYSVAKEFISLHEMNSPHPLARVLLCKTRIVNRAQRVLTYYSPPWQKYASQVFKGKTLEALSLSCRFGRRREIATGDCRPPNHRELLKKAKTSQSEVCKTFTLVSSARKRKMSATNEVRKQGKSFVNLFKGCRGLGTASPRSVNF